jgi:hypothetical protein
MNGCATKPPGTGGTRGTPGTVSLNCQIQQFKPNKSQDTCSGQIHSSGHKPIQ